MKAMLSTTLVALLSIGLASGVGANATTKISPASPCGVATTADYSHVVWIMLENVGYSVIGSSDAAYFNQLADRCGLATHDDAVSHPSLPNYIALTSGSTQGITDDGEPSEHPLSTTSLFSQLGANWRTLAQSMPTKCDRVTSGDYAARHNPAVYYTSISARCKQNDVPLVLPLDLRAKFTMIVPNVCDDMHSCPVNVGDAWLRSMVPMILDSAQYQSKSLVLIITFDENDSAASNQVPTVVVAPTVRIGTRDGARLTHYSLLRTTEDILHLPPLRAARTANSMVSGFNLAK
ncbi:MAG: acid phosphatase [Acidimicrobiaceae bacterium]|nr:acid phosphatase [Acidimicrobiaceae bacterium]